MFNRWNRWKLAMTVLLLAGLCGCNGATIPWENSQGSVGGSISVEGSGLVNLDGSGTPGALDAAKVGVRVIEPIVDIDSVEIETSGSILAATPVSPGIAKLLQVELLPAENLEGTGSGPTPVTLSVPITIEEGQSTTVAMQVTFVQESAGVAKAGSQAGRPWFVRLRYTISGPGAVTRQLRIRWHDRLVQYDSNLNDSFDDEDSYDDSDRDGLSNEYRSVIDQIVTDRPLITVSGQLVSFNPDEHSVTLDSGMQLRITEITAITLNGNAARPGVLQPGDMITARGYSVSEQLQRAVEIAARRDTDVASRR